MHAGKRLSPHEGSGATPLGEGSRSRHSGSFGFFEGVGSLGTQSGPNLTNGPTPTHHISHKVSQT